MKIGDLVEFSYGRLGGQIAGIGLLVAERPEKGEPLFSNAPGAEAFLVRGAPYDFGDYLRYQIDRQMRDAEAASEASRP